MCAAIFLVSLLFLHFYMKIKCNHILLIPMNTKKAKASNIILAILAIVASTLMSGFTYEHNPLGDHGVLGLTVSVGGISSC